MSCQTVARHSLNILAKITSATNSSGLQYMKKFNMNNLLFINLKTLLSFRGYRDSF
jgi:hypothetical protein